MRERRERLGGKRLQPRVVRGRGGHMIRVWGVLWGVLWGLGARMWGRWGFGQVRVWGR